MVKEGRNTRSWSAGALKRPAGHSFKVVKFGAFYSLYAPRSDSEVEDDEICAESAEELDPGRNLQLMN